MSLNLAGLPKRERAVQYVFKYSSSLQTAYLPACRVPLGIRHTFSPYSPRLVRAAFALLASRFVSKYFLAIGLPNYIYFVPLLCRERDNHLPVLVFGFAKLRVREKTAIILLVQPLVECPQPIQRGLPVREGDIVFQVLSQQKHIPELLAVVLRYNPRFRT